MKPLLKQLTLEYQSKWAHTGVLAASLLTTLMLTVINWKKMAEYSPGGDDYSLIEASKQFDIGSWLFKGFSDYFLVFDGTLPYTNFVRPVVNLVFWLSHLLFSCNIGLYFLSSLIFIGLYCFVMLILAGSRLQSILLVCLFCIGSPSIAQASLSSPACVFDVLAAFFVLGAIIFASRNKFFVSVLFLLFSVFTKEIGLVSCLAFAAWSLWPLIHHKSTCHPRKSISRAIGYITPIIIYAFVRIFGVGIGGTYSTSNLDLVSLIQRIIFFPLRFPMGLQVKLYGFRDAIKSGEFGDLLIRTLPVLICFLSFVFSTWFLVLYIRRLLRKGSLANSANTRLSASSELMLFIFPLTGLYLCIMGTDGRFYPLPQACIIILLLKSLDYRIIGSRLFSCMFLILMVVYSSLFVSYAKSTWSYTPCTVDTVFLKVFHTATENNMKRLLLINGPNIYSSPKYIASYHGFSGDMDLLYNSRGACGLDPNFRITKLNNNTDYAYILEAGPGGYFSDYMSDCTQEIAFNGYSHQSKQEGGKSIISVAGNVFHFSIDGVRGSSQIESLEFVKIKREYDGIFIANYHTGQVKILTPVTYLVQ